MTTYQMVKQRVQDALHELQEGREGSSSEPFGGLERSQVAQESRCFNDLQIDAKKCRKILTKIVYLLNQGEVFTDNEGTDIFFGVTKLFQCTNQDLRRMLYLVIKELKPKDTEVFILTSCITKDMNSSSDLLRANAIRVLVKILEPQSLHQFERNIKQAIMHKNPSVATASLVAGLHLFPMSPEIIKKWASDVQAKLNANTKECTQHAMRLLYEIKEQDRGALSKIILGLIKQSLKSTLAHVQLIKLCRDTLNTNEDYVIDQNIYEFLENSLHKSNEMIILEAAKTICSLSDVSTKLLQDANRILQMFLSSHKPVLKFAALRTYNKLAGTYPKIVASNQSELESLINDNNRGVATLAMSTLLKLSTDGNVEGLLKQISGLMSEISDDFKMEVIDAVKNVGERLPHKHRETLTFVAQCLREEGGFEFKRSIVEAIFSTIETNPDAKEIALMSLAEYIEDCCYVSLQTRILDLLGREGPKMSNPSKLIRFVYNRCILEKPTVRASAVNCLAEFGFRVPDLKESIKVLLKKSLYDNDDEIRERADLYCKAFEAEDLKIIPTQPNLNVDIDNFEQALLAHKSKLDAGESDEAFTLDLYTNTYGGAPAIARKKSSISEPNKPKRTQTKDEVAHQEAAIQEEKKRGERDQHLQSILGEFVFLGEKLLTSQPMEITESSAEYHVVLTKHAYANNLVLQFDVTNTLEDQRLNDVYVELDQSNKEMFEVVDVKKSEAVSFNETKSCYIVLAPTEEKYAMGTMGAELRFNIAEIDVATQDVLGEYDDDYKLEDVTISAADYIKKQRIPDGEFRMNWGSLAGELTQGYALSYTSLESAVSNLIKFLNMTPCDHSDTVEADGSTHMIMLTGLFLGRIQTCVMAKIGIDANMGCLVQVKVRSEEEEAARAILNCIA